MVLQAIRQVIEQWHPPRDRVLWAPVLLGAGIALYFSLPHELEYWESASILAAATLLLITLIRRAPQFSFIGGAVFLVSLGFLLAQGRAMTLHAPQLNRDTGVTRVEGRVLDVSVSDDDRDTSKRRVTLSDLKIEKLKPSETPYSIRLSSRHVPADVKPGERIALLAKLMPPSGPVAPDGFNYRRQAYFERIGAVGFTLGKFERLEAPDAHTDVWFNALRQSISKHISATMKHPESAVANALLAGERSDIPDDVNQNLIDSGLYHLLSISGLHVAIVCGVIFFTLRFAMALWPWAALHLPIKKIAAVAALSTGVFYTLLAGAPVPTQRSMLTTGIVLLAVILDRAALSLRTLALGAMIILTLRPEALVGASFQLSFAAVVSMVVFHETLGRKWMIEGRDTNAFMKFIGYFGSIAITTVLVSIATFPIILHHFGRVQVYGVLANAAAIPLTSFVVMPAGMAAMVLMPFGLDGPFLKIVEWGVTATLDVAAWVAHLPHAAWSLPVLPVGVYLVAAFGFLLVCLWRGTFRWIGVPLMLGAIIYGFTVPPRPVLMIDADARVAAVASNGQIGYLFKKPTEYLRKNWLSVWGGHELNDAKALKGQTLQVGEVAVTCDDLACRVQSGEHKLSILKSANALAEECAWSTLIVAIDKAVMPKACKTTVIPFWDIRDAGGMAFYADAGKVWRVKPFNPEGETQPWSLD